MKRVNNRKIKGKDPKVFGKKILGISDERWKKRIGKDVRHFLGWSLDFGLQVFWGQTEEPGPRNQAT